MGEPAVPVDYSRVPWCIYCHPEVAYAGVTEATARQRGFDVAVQKYPLGGNSRTRIIGDTEGLVKIVTERQADGRTAHPTLSESFDETVLALTGRGLHLG